MAKNISYNKIMVTNCDSTDNWTMGSDESIATEEGKGVLDGTCVNWTTDTSDHEGYYEFNDGSTYDLTQYDLSFWFKYSKGKAGQYLEDTDSFFVRIYDASGNWGDWLIGGHLSLDNNWTCYSYSGSNYDTKSETEPDLTNITAIRWRLMWKDANDGDDEVPLRIDEIKIGNRYIIIGGASDDVITFDDVIEYDINNAIGLIERTGSFIRLRAGLEFGDDSTDTYFTENNLYIYNDQQSEEVDHDTVVKSIVYITFGENFTSVDSGVEYSINGCSLVIKEGSSSNIYISEGASFEIYDSKIQNYNVIRFGETSSNSSTTVIKIKKCSLYDNASIYFNSDKIIAYDVEMYNATSDNLIFINENPTDMKDINLHHSTNAIVCSCNLQGENIVLNDNTTDIKVIDGYDLLLINPTVDSSKIIKE